MLLLTNYTRMSFSLVSFYGETQYIAINHRK
nr:MAG TPA: hypothetical protein [Caudoviricetes sp.]DAY12884.1 MAG TPA: hypothetical protein [Caudoviricetes sp.]